MERLLPPSSHSPPPHSPPSTPHPTGPNRRQAVVFVANSADQQTLLWHQMAEVCGARVTLMQAVGVPSPTPALPQSPAASPASGSPYTQGTLIVGDGNFSFSAAVCTLLGGGQGITATAYDREEDVKSKYPVNCVSQCRAMGAQVHFGLDATQMIRDSRVNGTQYCFIVFNFPHTDHQQTSDDAEEVRAPSRRAPLDKAAPGGGGRACIVRGDETIVPQRLAGNEFWQV